METDHEVGQNKDAVRRGKMSKERIKNLPRSEQLLYKTYPLLNKIKKETKTHMSGDTYSQIIDLQNKIKECLNIGSQ